MFKREMGFLKYEVLSKIFLQEFWTLITILENQNIIWGSAEKWTPKKGYYRHTAKKPAPYWKNVFKFPWGFLHFLALSGVTEVSEL